MAVIVGAEEVLDVVQDRTQVAAEAVLQTLTPEQRHQLWLFNKSNLSWKSWKQRRRFAVIRRNGLKTARAWVIKEEFRWFWRHVYSTSDEEFFNRWYAWGARCRLRPVVKVAKMLKRHLPNLLSYFLYRITNATSEGFKSVIQALKYAARGFRSFTNYRRESCSFAANWISSRSYSATKSPEEPLIRLRVTASRRTIDSRDAHQGGHRP